MIRLDIEILKTKLTELMDKDHENQKKVASETPVVASDGTEVLPLLVYEDALNNYDKFEYCNTFEGTL